MFGSVRRGSLISTYLRQIKSASFAPIKAREGGSRIGAQMQSVKAVTSTAKKKRDPYYLRFLPLAHYLAHCPISFPRYHLLDGPTSFRHSCELACSSASPNVRKCVKPSLSLSASATPASCFPHGSC